MTFEKFVDRRHERITELAAFAARFENAQQRGEHGDAGEEGDQHAEAGDQAEFGQAFVIRRQERQKARRGRERRKRQRRAGAPAGAQKRFMQAVDFMPLGTVADAELQPEIDTETHEQHGEVHRYQVERADQQQSKRRRDREADDQGGEHRENDPEPSQRHPQDEQHDRDRDRSVKRGVLLDGGELVVVHWDRDR